MPSAPRDARARARRPRLRHRGNLPSQSACRIRLLGVHRCGISLRDAMRIAVVAPVWFPVPPTGYGGIELVVSLLADGLVDAGHDVTLFASGGSHTKAKLVSPMPEPPDPRELGNAWYDGYHALSAYLESQATAGSTSCTTTPASSGRCAARCCADGRPSCTRCTDRGPTQTRSFYSVAGHHVHLVAISDAQRADNPDVPVRGHGPQRHRPRRRTRTARARTTSSSTSGAPTPTRDRRKRSRSPAAPGFRCT